MGLAVSHMLCCPSTDLADNCIDATQHRWSMTKWDKETSTPIRQNGFYFFFLGGLKTLQSRDQTLLSLFDSSVH